MRYSGAVVCVICLWGATQAPAQMDRRVTVVGKAAGTDVKASDEAKMDAKRNAVEQAAGLFINAMSETEDFVLVKDRILGQAAGYITEYNVNREWTENGVTFCEITAAVSVSRFERDWAAFAHAKEDEGNPRMMVVIIEDNDVDDLKEPVYNGVCQSKIENFFLSKDIQLMDQGVSEEVRERDLTLAALNNNVTRLAAIAAEFKAEILVYGRAEARRGRSVSIGGRNAYRWDITLNVRAVQADSAAMLSSNTYSPRKPYMTTSAAAGNDAFARLADDVGAQVLTDVLKAWKSRSGHRRILQASFSPVSRKQAKAIMAALAAHRGVVRGEEGAKLRNLSQGVANIEVDWKFDLDLLADTIEDLKIDGLGFEVVEQAANRIDVKVIGAE